MSLYFKPEEDTMTNDIFLRLYINPPRPHTHTRLRKNICLPSILKSSTNYFLSLCIPLYALKLYNYYRHHTSDLFDHKKKNYKNNLSNQINKRKQ